MFEFIFGTPKPRPEKKDDMKPKPCCVCKDEKAKRDECMLFAEDGSKAEAKCKDSIEAYRLCMESYGFKLPAGGNGAAA